MDKKMLESYAIWAKKNLEQQVEVSLNKIGIHSDNDIKKMHISGDIATIDGDQTSYTLDFANKRKSVVRMVEIDGYRTVITETAYTWFNRLIALRFMELHGYLAHGFRVLSNPNNSVEPEILKNLSLAKFDLSLDMDYCDKLKSDNKIEELFRHVLLKQCQALSKTIPMLFSENTDAYELLLPNTLITGESVLTKLLEIPEENFLDDVEVIGWLYQYYNTEAKAKVFARSSKEKIKKDEIPAATQLFTPDWIVRYMVENTLGRLWIDGHKNTPIKSEWKYYLEEAEQSPHVQKQLEELKNERKNITPEQIRFIDPCMGSGHILVYAFDVLMQIYRIYGYSDKDAVHSIITNNLYGLELDKRAYQLACFAVIMRALKYDKRFLRTYENGGITLNLSHFQNLQINNISFLDDPIQKIIAQFKNADTFGSLTRVEKQDGLEQYFEKFVPTIDFDEHHLIHYRKLYNILTMKYDVVCTNPPYMKGSKANNLLKSYIENQYPDSKADLFAVFIEKCAELSKINGYYAMITQHSWMFLSSYEKLRKKLQLKTIINMVHLGAKAFEEIGGEVVQTTSFVMFKHIPNYNEMYVRLVDVSGEEKKREAFFKKENYYLSTQEKYEKIPGSPIAYWANQKIIDIFQNTLLKQIAEPRAGLQTNNNDLFVRSWYEIDINKMYLYAKDENDEHLFKFRWFPYNKGGTFHRWYGNNVLVVDWEGKGKRIHDYANIPLDYRGAPVRNKQFYFKESVTWSAISSGNLSVRYCQNGFIFDTKGSSCFFKNHDETMYYLGFLNSKVVQKFLLYLSPTLDYGVGAMAKLPTIYDFEYSNSIILIVSECIELCRSDWDSFEISWDFKEHPFIKWSKELWDATAIGATMQYYYGEHIKVTCPLELCFMLWQGECNDRFKKLKANEEELNHIFIDIYGLQDELNSEVYDKDITVYSANLQDDMKSFISYLIGLIMGRYSLDYEGIAYAGGKWDESRYKRYIPDDDGIVPIYPFVGMKKGLTAQICNLVKMIYGEDSYRRNLEFIAQALGKKNAESAEETLNRYLNNDFYTDHLKRYKKCPIYWMLSSGSEGGFKCLIYMHRYNEDTLARTNAMYYLPDSTRLKNELDETLVALTTASGKDKIALEKKRQILAARYNEALEYGQILDYMANKYISIDLDDGVKVNYEKFQNIEITTDNGTKVRKDLLIPLK